MVNLERMNKLSKAVNRFSSGTIDPAEVIPEAVHELEQMRQEMSEMIATLPGITDQIIMTLAYLKGCDAETIANSGECSVRKVFYHLKNAKAQLLEMYPDKITMC